MSLWAAVFSPEMRLLDPGLLQFPVQELDTTAPQFIEPVLSSTSASSTRLEELTTSASISMFIVSKEPPARPASERKTVSIVASVETWKPLSVFVTFRLAIVNCESSTPKPST